MTTTTFSPVNRRLSIIEELGHAISCLHAALVRIADRRTVLRADAPTLFLLSIGIERYLKVAVHILHHEKSGQFADYSTMKGYGHDLLVLEATVLSLEFPTARGNLPMDPNKSPQARWDDILEIASDRNPSLFLDSERARRAPYQVLSPPICAFS